MRSGVDSNVRKSVLASSKEGKKGGTFLPPRDYLAESGGHRSKASRFWERGGEERKETTDNTGVVLTMNVFLG